MNRPGPPAQAPQFPQMPQMPPMNPNAPVRIKTEPGLEQGGAPPAYAGMGNATTAQQRAAQNLQASYGARAAASINAIQGMPQPGQQLPGQAGQQPHQQQQIQHPQQQRPAGQPMRPQMTPTQYQQAIAQQAAFQKQQLQQQQQQEQAKVAQQAGQGTTNGAQHAQTDGSWDEDEGRHSHFGVLKQIGVDGSETSMGRVEVDGLIRRQIEARGKAMEGGGLMLPLKRQKVPGARRERKHAAGTGPNVSQTDGGDDDDDDDEKILKAEDDDEDAINSDLDDPDDPKSDDSGDDETPQVMLCMYDKVQRVKNKWFVFPQDQPNFMPLSHREAGRRVY